MPSASFPSCSCAARRLGLGVLALGLVAAGIAIGSRLGDDAAPTTSLLAPRSAAADAPPAVALAAFAAQHDPADDDAKREMEMLAYGVGYYLGREVDEGIRIDQVNVDRADVERGFDDGLSGAEPAFDEDAIDDLLQAVHRTMQQRMVERMLAEDSNFKRLHDANAEAGAAFLEQNRKRVGMVMLGRGIQYLEMKPGLGYRPSAGDRVLVSYEARRLDGTPFAKGVRQVVEVDDVTEGSRIVLTTMQVGAKWEVAMPADMAYGPGGDPPLIGPNETFVVEVELHKILKPGETE